MPVICRIGLLTTKIPDVDVTTSQASHLYDLVANVTHESVAGTTRDKENTTWKVHLRAGEGENEKWYTIQDLIVEETRKEMIFLGESVLQVGILCRPYRASLRVFLTRSGKRDSSLKVPPFFRQTFIPFL